MKITINNSTAKHKKEAKTMGK